MLARMLIQSLIGVAFFAALLFIPAGGWDWPEGWAYLALFSACSLATGAWLWKTDPDLLAARMQSPLSREQKPRDRAIAIAMLIVFCAWVILIALDAHRFQWSQAPLWAQVVGAALIVWSFWGWTRVLRANSFAATTVRVQSEREQYVISTGPYAVVRHPMYAYAIPFSIGTPLMLGSLWGLLGLVPSPASVARRVRHVAP
jgi:protein-S-isoprenylcysteine O-methyltransferase Ste14